MQFYIRNFARLLFISSLILSPNDATSASTTPSNTLPEVFQRPENRILNRFEKSLPSTKIQNLDANQQSNEGLKIISKTLIILAPKELQKKVNFTKYQQK